MVTKVIAHLKHFLLIYKHKCDYSFFYLLLVTMCPLLLNFHCTIWGPKCSLNSRIPEMNYQVFMSIFDKTSKFQILRSLSLTYEHDSSQILCCYDNLFFYRAPEIHELFVMIWNHNCLLSGKKIIATGLGVGKRYFLLLFFIQIAEYFFFF